MKKICLKKKKKKKTKTSFVLFPGFTEKNIGIFWLCFTWRSNMVQPPAATQTVARFGAAAPRAGSERAAWRRPPGAARRPWRASPRPWKRFSKLHPSQVEKIGYYLVITFILELFDGYFKKKVETC